MILYHILSTTGEIKICMKFAQSSGAVEYTDCISAVENDPYPHPKVCLGYDIKQSDGEVSVMLGLYGIQSTPLFPSLPDQLWPGVVEFVFSF